MKRNMNMSICKEGTYAVHSCEQLWCLEATCLLLEDFGRNVMEGSEIYASQTLKPQAPDARSLRPLNPKHLLPQTLKPKPTP